MINANSGPRITRNMARDILDSAIGHILKLRAKTDPNGSEYIVLIEAGGTLARCHNKIEVYEEISLVSDERALVAT